MLAHAWQTTGFACTSAAREDGTRALGGSGGSRINLVPFIETGQEQSVLCHGNIQGLSDSEAFWISEFLMREAQPLTHASEVSASDAA